MIKKYSSLLALALLIASSCQQSPSSQQSSTPADSTAITSSFDTTLDGQAVSLYSIGNEKLKVNITNYGARLVDLIVKDKNGKEVDVILGFDTAKEFIKYANNFYGAIVGRYGNRIANASFSINGNTYNLEKNDNGHSLHGGTNGVFNRVWNVESSSEQSITLAYTSPDGEAGYPGTVKMKVTYTVTDEGGLVLSYEADTDKETVLNLTNHAYFNLNGEGDTTILDHELWVDADHITEVNSTLIPTGKSLAVKGTAFDFTNPKTIGSDINQEHMQLTYGKGYDHNFELNRKGNNFVAVASLYASKTGIEMKIFTTEPGLQFYSGNFMSDVDPKGKRGKGYPYRSALCLETQHFPDSPNHPSFPSTQLKPGEKYVSKTEYRFTVR